jgi:O-antigen ligase
VLFVCSASGYIVVIGASSRGSQLGLLAIGIWLLLKQKNGFKGLFLMIIVAAIIFRFLPEAQMQRFSEMGEDSDSVQRLTYWAYGLNEVIPSHPLLGVGYKNWLPYLNYFVPEGMGPQQQNQAPHNIFIQAAAELGLIGFLVYLLMIYYSFKNNLRTRQMAKEINKPLLFNLSYGLDAGLIGFLVAGSFVSVFYYPFFWIQMTMIVMLNNVTKQQYLALTAKK